MEDNLGYIIFGFFVFVAILEGIFKVTDKRTKHGRKVKWIFRAVGIVILTIIALIYILG